MGDAISASERFGEASGKRGVWRGWVIGAIVCCAAHGDDKWRDYAAYDAAMQQLAAESAGLAKLSPLAVTPAGRTVHLVTIGAGGERPLDAGPAVLVVGGIDAERPDSSDVAVEVARRLLAGREDAATKGLLQRCVFYFVPRANPDGVERCFAAPLHETRLNARPIDDDRDGSADEDGPDDLNGDGLITLMRVRDPLGEWRVDKDEPRLMKKADRLEGERGEYRVLLEGLDKDADGEINEDPVGGVDADRNWPHFFEPGVPEAGRTPLSETSTRALAQFVVDHPNIALAVVYGRNDTLVQVPGGKERGPDKKAYRDLHEDDVALYERISERFRARTGLKGSAGARAQGALYAWLYSQRGIPTFATSLWWPLDAKQDEPASQPAADDASGASTDRSQPGETRAAESEPDTSEPDTSEPDAPAAETAPASVSEQSESKSDRSSKKDKAGKDKAAKLEGAAELAFSGFEARVESSDALKKWLAYSDASRGGAGFMPWTDFEHPTLGKVEIGGLAPLFTAAPPEEIDRVAEAQAAALVELAGLLARPRLMTGPVSHLGVDVWQVELYVVNDGYLPTHLAIARQLENPPLVVRPELDAARVVGGRWQERVDNVPGSGGTVRLRWLVRGKKGESVAFRAFNRMCGAFATTVKLEESLAMGEDQ